MTEQNTRIPDSAQLPPRLGAASRALRWAGITFGGFLAMIMVIVAIFVLLGVPIDLSVLRDRVEAAATEAS